MMLNTKEIVKFGILGAVIYVLKLIMASLPNIHLVAVLIAVYTIVYRKNAIFPIMIYILLEGLFGGFTVWWIAYLYIWPLLFAIILLIPKNTKWFIYCSILGLHGLLFGLLYLPLELIIFKFNLAACISWIMAGLGYDLMHGISNLCLGILVIPLVKILKRVDHGAEL